MNCPRCPGSILEERERGGITVDTCTVCRGLWLDRGELEKLIARETRDLDEMDRRRYDARPREYRYDGDDEHHYRGPRRKRSWVETLGDIFD